MSKRSFSNYAGHPNGIEDGIYDANAEQGSIRTIVNNDVGYLARRFRNATSTQSKDKITIPLNKEHDLSMFPKEPIFVLQDDENISGNYYQATKTKGLFSSINGIDITFCKTSADLTKRLRFLGYWGLGDKFEADSTKGNTNGFEEATLITGGPLTIKNNGDDELDIGDLVGYKVRYYDCNRGVYPDNVWVANHKKEGVTNRSTHVTPQLTKMDPSCYYEEANSLIMDSFYLWDKGGDSLNQRSETGSDTYNYALSQLKEIASIGALTLIAGIDATKIKVIPRIKDNDNEESRNTYYRAYEIVDEFMRGDINQAEMNAELGSIKAEINPKKATIEEKKARMASNYRDIAKETGWHNSEGDETISPSKSTIMNSIIEELKYSMIPSKTVQSLTLGASEHGELVSNSLECLRNSIVDHSKYLMTQCVNFAGVIMRGGGPGDDVDILMTKLVK